MTDILASILEPEAKPDLGPWMLTHSGRRVYFLQPSAQMIAPADLAWHLAHQCRFNGASSSFYSVAQHCVIGSKLAERLGHSKLIQLGVLLHDAAEAYIGDLVSPLKLALGDEAMARYHEVEKRLLVSIYTRAGIDWASPKLTDDYWATIKQIDHWLLAAERVTLMPDEPSWAPPLHPDLPRVHPWPIEVSRKNYLQRYNALTNRP